MVATPTQLCFFRWKKEHEAQITALPRVSLERRRGQHSAKALPGPDWVAKTKSTSNHEALSEASGERPSIKPAQGLTFRAARGKAAPCLVTIPRQSSLQWKEDSRKHADPSLNPFPTESPLPQGFLCVCMAPPAGGHCHCAPRPLPQSGIVAGGGGVADFFSKFPPLRGVE